MLLVTSRLPYPPLGGDKVRADFFVQRLARHYDVHLVSLSDRPLPPESEAYLRRHCATYTVFPIPRWGHLLGALMALVRGRPLQVGYYDVGAVARHVRTLEPSVDFGVAINQRAASYLFGFSKPCFLEMTDSQTLMCRHGATHAGSWVWRMIYRIEAPRIEAFERDCIARFRATFFVNRDEEQFYGRPDRTRWLPNAVDEALLRRGRPPTLERAFCYLGRLDYQPNVDAVTWFGEQVLPRLPSDVVWYVIGPAAKPPILALAARHPNVRVTGYLDDPWARVAGCACMVAPMQTGAGSQYKILEAMALGVPVVTTRRGAGPIVGARDSVHMVVEDDPDAMARAVMGLVTDPGRAAAIGAAGRELIRSAYTWDAAERSLLETIETELGGPAPR